MAQTLLDFVGLDLAFIAAAVVILWFTHRPKSWSQGLRGAGLQLFPLPKIALDTAKLLAYLMWVAIGVALVTQIFFHDPYTKVKETVEVISTLPIGIIVYLFTVRIFTEELLFRAALVQPLGYRPAAVIFALAHAGYGSIGQFLGALAAGLVLGHYYEKNRSIVPTFLAHLLYNIFSAVLTLYTIGHA